VQGYRGLWGLYVADPVAGENAPAGPKFQRDGTVRRCWHDPVGWAGLDHLPPPTSALRVAETSLQALEDEDARLAQEVEHKAAEVERLGVELEALRGKAHLRTLLADHQRRLRTLSTELGALRADAANRAALGEALREHAERLRSGSSPNQTTGPRRHTPWDARKQPLGVLAEVWAAASISLLLIGFVVLEILDVATAPALAGLVAVMFALELLIRRGARPVIWSGVNAMAVAGAVVLIYHLFWVIIVAAAAVVAVLILVENLAELRR
jgi:hypothetical protein